MTVIDFVKIRIEGINPKDLEQHPVLQFVQDFCEKTGEMFPNKKRAEYHGLTVWIFDGRTVMLKGSLHKFWNELHGRTDKSGTGINWNDFPAEALQETILLLSELIGTPPDTFRLQNLEFGVNLIEPAHTPAKVLQSLLLHQHKPFDRMTGKVGRRSIGKEVSNQRYTIKIYNKGYQAGLVFKVLRYEIKTTRMEHLADAGIHNLADLLQPTRLASLQRILEASLDNILLHDPEVKAKDLTPATRKFWNATRHPTYWTDLRCLDRRKFERQRRRHRKIVEQTTPYGMLPDLKASIAKKWQDLLNNDPKNTTNLTDFVTKMGNQENDRFNTSSSMLNRSYELMPDVRTCKSCGRDISHRRKNAVFCSSKACRNADSNPRNNRKRKYGTELGLELFDVKDLQNSLYS